MPNRTVWHVGGEDVYLRIPLLLRLREKGFRVGAVGSSQSDAFKENNIEYYCYSLQRGVAPLSDRRARARLFELFCRHKPDIVHGFDTKPAILAPIAGSAAGVPGRVRTVTGMGYVFSSTSPLTLAIRPFYRCLQRQASKAANVTVFQNYDDRAYFREHAMVRPDRDALVPGSGIDVNKLRASRPNRVVLDRLREELGVCGRPTVTMISRLVRHKGVIEFLEASRLVRERHVDACFLLVGPVDSEGQQRVTHREIDDYADTVCYLGRREDVTALLAVSDIFVLPSYYREGVPRVLLEAAAMSVPLITTDMPGCREVVRQRYNGLLVRPRDATALAESIIHLLKSDHTRSEMAQRACQYVQERFDLSKVANAYAEIYNRILS